MQPPQISALVTQVCHAVQGADPGAAENAVAIVTEGTGHHITMHKKRRWI